MQRCLVVRCPKVPLFEPRQADPTRSGSDVAAELVSPESLFLLLIDLRHSSSLDSPRTACTKAFFDQLLNLKQPEEVQFPVPLHHDLTLPVLFYYSKLFRVEVV